MKRLLLIVSAILISLTFTNAQDLQKEKDAIKQVINSAYMDGLENVGDVEAAAKGFHPAFNIMGVNQRNQLWQYPIYNWLETTKQRKEAGQFPPEKKITFKYPMIDVTGNAAVVKVEFYEGDVLKYIDYLSLYKFNTDWRIVNKIYYEFPKENN